MQCVGIPELHEMSFIQSLCNDSSIDYNEHKKAYEKIGEPTEVNFCSGRSFDLYIYEKKFYFSLNSTIILKFYVTGSYLKYVFRTSNFNCSVCSP